MMDNFVNMVNLVPINYYTSILDGGAYDYNIKKMFIHKKGIDYSKLKMTEEGRYSITKPFDGVVIIKHIKSIVNNNLIDLDITDLTGNVGGDTILFAMHFRKVYSIEINDDNYDALQNNVMVYKLNNVKLFKGDSTKLYKWKTDILYMDPPWGGPDYKQYDKIDLYLGSIRVDKFIKYIIKKDWKPSYIFMKLPYNYNFDRLYKLIEASKIHIWTIRTYKLICIDLK
jgi:hypothetical protein